MSRLLFVDDDVFMLKSIKRTLHNLDFECYFTNSGFEALKIVNDKPIDIVITDMKMPAMNGLELLNKMDEIDDSILKIIISGSVYMQELIQTVNQVNVFRYVAKPFEVGKDLVPILYEAVEYSRFKKIQDLKEKASTSQNEVYRNALNQLDIKFHANEIELNIVKIYQQLFLKSLYEQIEQQVSDEKRKQFYLSYENFLVDVLHQAEKNSLLFKAMTLKENILSMFDSVNISVNDALLGNDYAQGIGNYVEPILLSIMKGLTTIDREDCLELDLSVDDKMCLICTLRSEHNNFEIFSAKTQFHFLESILNTFGDSIELNEISKKTVLVLKVKLYEYQSI